MSFPATCKAVISLVESGTAEAVPFADLVESGTVQAVPFVLTFFRNL
jgi:hypothetical protein